MECRAAPGLPFPAPLREKNKNKQKKTQDTPLLYRESLLVAERGRARLNQKHGPARLLEQRSRPPLLLTSGRWQPEVGLSVRRCCRARMLFVHVGVSGPVFAVLTLGCPRHGSGVSAESRAPAGV